MKKNPTPRLFINRDGTRNAIASRTDRCSSVQRGIVRQADSWSAQHRDLEIDEPSLDQPAL
jgi:hypothetical protein